MEQHFAPSPAYVPEYVTVLHKVADEGGHLKDAYELFAAFWRAQPERLWHQSLSHSHVPLSEFFDAVKAVLGRTFDVYDSGDLKPCSGCGEPEWEDADWHEDFYYGSEVCEGCYDNGYSCDHCGAFSVNTYCWDYLEDDRYCSSCSDTYIYYCDDCDQSYHRDNGHDCESEDYCDCEPMHDSNALSFEILANSHGTISQDERLKVSLPSGALTEDAMLAVERMLWNDQLGLAHYDSQVDGKGVYTDASTWVKPDRHDLATLMSTIEPVWQASKGGNLPKRIARALYKTYGIKLDEGILSRIGSTARSHTDSKSEWHVEFTRDFSGGAAAFYHKDSCWWQSYNASLCALKHWGGMGMRSYADEGTDRAFPTGRVWVQPLNADLEPCLEVKDAHAYIVYNGYGDLSGYTAARILSYLTSKSYKKIEDFSANHQYVNAGGYLVADVETCEKTTTLYIGRNLRHHVKAA